MQYRFILFLILYCLPTWLIGQSACPNLDFETGTFSSWSGTYGCNQGDYNDFDIYYTPNCEFPNWGITAPSGYTLEQPQASNVNNLDGQHAIVQSTWNGGVDPYVPALSLQSPLGGNNVGRLGDYYNGARVGGLTYSLTVDSNNALLTAYYAIVLEAPSHTTFENPYFRIRLFDPNGNSVNCVEYIQDGAVGANGFQTYNCPNNDCISSADGNQLLENRLIWRDWTAISINLLPYIGQTVVLDFTSGDCSRTGHIGYTYIDLECNRNEITIETFNLCNGVSTGLSAPEGMSDYEWRFGSTNGPVIGNSRQVTATDTGLYFVTMTPFSTANSSCPFTMSAYVEPAQDLSGEIVATSDVSCKDGSDGEATVRGLAGQPLYTYQWDDPQSQTTATATGLSAGTYTVTITDANGCTYELTVNIGEPLLDLTPSFVVVDVGCFGDNTGTVTLSGTGGTAPYQYSADGFNFTNNNFFSGLTAGQYTFYVRDANLCFASITVQIKQPNAPLDVSTVANPVTCNSFSDGSIESTATGGTTPYTYSWNDPQGQTTENATGLSAGTYQVIITDANGCQVTAIQEITEPQDFSITSNKQDILCFGENNGSASVQVNGGTPAYTYEWNDPLQQSSADAYGLYAGSYSVTVTDANGCEEIIPITITQPNPLNLSITKTNVACKGEESGSATVTVSGGTAPFIYQWDDNYNQTAATATQLVAGSYTVTVTDANGCRKSISVNITEPAFNLTAHISPIVHVSCFGAGDGEATAVPSGGTAPYSFQWNDAAGQVTSKASNLQPGSYTVIVTDANGCKTSSSVDITQPQNPISIVVDRTIDVDCFGNKTGSASVLVNGGTPPYSYLWNDQFLQTSPTAIGLGGGTYTVKVTDSKGCQKQLAVTIDEPTLLTSSVVSKKDVSCKGGTNGEAVVSVFGGTPGYSYQWNDPLNQTSPTALNLKAGSYTCVITDANGCTTSQTVQINEPSQVLALVLNSKSDAKCSGDQTGEATVTPSGGTPPYQFKWNDPLGQTTSTASNLPAGSYRVVVTDINGCQVFLDVVISAPQAPIAVNINIQNHVSCFGGSDAAVSAVVQGGTPTYTYSWTPSGQTGSSVVGLSAGTHSITVTDANGCSNIQSFAITQPQAPLNVVLERKADVSCFNGADGTISVDAAGGTPPYSYQWNDPLGQTGRTAINLTQGTYQVVVTDANECQDNLTVTLTAPTSPLAIAVTGNDIKCFGGNDGSATAVPTNGTAPYNYSWSDPLGQSSQTAVNLQAGSYTVNVTDFKGCVGTGSINLTQPSTNLTLAMSSSSVKCEGTNTGSASVNVSGGVAPYTYSWNDVLNQTTQTATSLPRGTYEVLVVDANGCEKLASIAVEEPDPLSLIVDFTEVVCPGTNKGKVSVSVTGGVGPYTYVWDDQNGTTSSTANGLAPGTYTVTVTDANNCQSSETVAITEEIKISLSLEAVNVSCNGADDGEILSTVEGATTPVTYEWFKGASTVVISNSNDLTNIGPGNYKLKITDGDGCPAEEVAEITQPAVLALNTNVVNLKCKGERSGSASVVATGGTEPYNYQWNDAFNQTSSTAISLFEGSYSVNVTDAHGCTKVANVVVDSPDLLDLTLNGQDVNCTGESTGIVTASVIGGTPGYNYQWNDPSGSQSNVLAGVPVGNYTVEVTDANGCSQSGSYQVRENLFPLSLDTDVKHAICRGDATGEANVYIFGGTSPYSVSWNDAQFQTTEKASNLFAGDYIVTVTDNLGCEASASVTIEQPAERLIADITAEMVRCKYDTNGTSFIIPSGGVPPYQYSWDDDFNQTTQKAIELPAGTFTGTVTDANGCQVSRTVTITEPDDILELNTTAQGVDCYNDTDGETHVQISGGTSPYTTIWDDENEQTSVDAYNLKADRYTVLVTDFNGCQATDTIEVIGPDSALNIQLIPTDALCFGEASGSIVSNITGSNPGYTYKWNNDLQSQTRNISGLKSRYYTVLVEDAKGCTKKDSVFVGQPDSVAVKIKTKDISCFDGSDGEIIASVFGGVQPYSYLWNDPQSQTTPKAENLKARVYQLRVTDANGCVTPINAVLNQPTFPIDIKPTAIPLKCFGDNNGRAFVKVDGGTGPYQYAWNDIYNQITDTAKNLTAGMYWVVVTDAMQCKDSIEVEITEPAAPISLNFLSSEADCFESSNGTATVIPTGGTPNYSFLWNDSKGQKTDEAIELKQGIYQVKVTDANGCTQSGSVAVEGPNNPLYVSISSQDVTCFGQTNGSVSADVTGGTAPFSYLWDTQNQQTQQSVTGLGAGVYSVEVTDSKGCIVTAQKAVSQPKKAIEISFETTDVTCNGFSDGYVLATIEGGTAPYTYQWDDPSQSTSRQIINVLSGQYTLTVEDINGCTFQKSVIVDQPTPALSVNTTSIDPTCFGYSNGEITSYPLGGTAPYTFNWNTPGAPNQPKIENIPAGTHILNVVDDNGCIASDTVVLNQPDEMFVTQQVMDITCFGDDDGQVDVTGHGGTPNYSYTLYIGGVPTTTTGQFNNVPPGIHQLELVDANQCLFQKDIEVKEPGELITKVEIQDVICNGQSNGEALITIESGGTKPYQIRWGSGAYLDTTAHYEKNLIANTYSYSVRDANNCMFVDNLTVSQPDPIGLITAEDDTICVGFNAQISASAMGGTPGFTFIWDNGVASGPSHSVTPDTTTVFKVYAQDANNCISDVDSVTVFVRSIIQDEISIEAPDSICEGESIQVRGFHNGTQGPYTYNWSPNIGSGKGPYIVKVDQSNLRLEFIVQDVCGAQILAQKDLTVLPTPQPFLEAVIDSGCAPVSVFLVDLVNGNSTSLEYTWNLGDGTTATGVPIQHTYETPGNYQVRVDVVSAYGCGSTSSDPGIIKVSPTPNAGASASAYEVDSRESEIEFFNESTDFYTWEWNFDDGTISNELNPIKDFGVGEFDVVLEVSNPNGCSDTVMLSIKVNPFYDFTVPSAFTPNSDGEGDGTYDPNATDNDVFFPFTDYVQEYLFQIYNRWGELVFESTDLNIGWTGYYKGKLAQQDVYVWKIKATYVDGTELTKTGDVTLIRR